MQEGEHTLTAGTQEPTTTSSEVRNTAGEPAASCASTGLPLRTSAKSAPVKPAWYWAHASK